VGQMNRATNRQLQRRQRQLACEQAGNMKDTKKQGPFRLSRMRCRNE
jgi:hypothetical protein